MAVTGSEVAPAWIRKVAERGWKEVDGFKRYFSGRIGRTWCE